jgi:hypothetical protein
MQIALVVILKGNQVPDYLTIEKSIREMINKLIIFTGRKREAGSPKNDIPSV